MRSGILDKQETISIKRYSNLPKADTIGEKKNVHFIEIPVL